MKAHAKIRTAQTVVRRFVMEPIRLRAVSFFGLGDL